MIEFDIQLFATISNSNSNTLISGTSGDDSIINILSGATINALAGNDNIENSGASVSIQGGYGNDLIKNFGNYLINYSDTYSSIFGGAGNDSIYNEIEHTKIYGEEGNDYVSNNGWYSTINAGSGVDVIDNSAAWTSINSGEGNDLINLNDNYVRVTVNAGKGDDTIYNSGASMIQYANGDGNDIIYGYDGCNLSDTLQITGAKYTTTKSGENVIIGVGSGKITVVGGANVDFTIDGTLASGGSDTTPPDTTPPDTTPPDTTPPDTTPAETLPNGWKYASDAKTSMTATLATADNLDLTENYGAGVIKVDGSKTTGGIVIYGNDENNSIKGGKGADTISGGNGDDTISLGSGEDIYIYSGGNDLIQDYATVDAIQIDTLAVEITGVETVSSNVIYSTSEGEITVKSGKGKSIKLVDAKGKEIIFEEEEVLYKEGTANADNIDNGDDNATIAALAGNDKITNSGGAVSINTGDGNDKITLESGAENVTVTGGKGTDTIYNESSGNLYQYASGDGNDVIVGYDETDTLHITSGTYSYSISGSDFIVKVGSSTIKLKDAADKNILLKNASGKIETVSPEVDELPEGWKYGTTSKTNTTATILTASIGTAEKEIYLTDDYGDGVIKVDASKVSDAIIIGNAEDNSIKTGAGNDELDGGEGNDTLTGGKGDDIFIYSGGDDIITDYGTGVDSIQITSDIEFVDYETLKSDVVYYTNDGTLTVKNAIKSGVLKEIILMDEGNNVIKYPTAEPPMGWQLDNDKHLLKATLASAENEIDLAEDYGADIEKVDGSKIGGGVEIYGNDLDNSIKGGKGNDELDGGAGNDTLTGGAGEDVFVYSGGDDVITDYVAGHDSIRVEIDDISEIEAETVGADVVYNTANGKIKVTKGNGKNITLMDINGDIIPIVGGKIPEGWQLDTAKHILRASVASADNEVDLSEVYGAGIEKVDGSKISGGVDIYGNDLNNSLKGGKGNDILDGGTGNDTLTSGTGDDVFIYSGGDDYITDYTAGKDYIKIDINEIEILSFETVGSNVVYYTDAGNLTVKNGNGKEIILIDADENPIVIGAQFPDGWNFDSAKKLLQATVAGADNYIDLSEKYGADVIKVDGSKITSGVDIYGNDNDNSLKGGRGADLIGGGYGNDTVSLGGGADTYYYIGGDDTITDYATMDAIQFDTENISDFSREISGKNVIYTTNVGTLTLKNASTKNITILDGNGEEFNISQNVSENLWFMEVDFTSCDIDSICKEKYSVTEIQTANYNFEQEQNILTYGEDK